MNVTDSSSNGVIGDKVRLKSGGPIMTITGVNYPFVQTSWFEGDAERGYGVLQQASFLALTLNRLS